jgi:hypothetical protein
MALDLSDCQFQGPALPEPFVKLELEKELVRVKLLPKTMGAEGKEISQQWDVYRCKLREIMASGGALRVRNHVIEPIQALLGYSLIDAAPEVETREDLESGGSLLITEHGKSRLRVWTTGFDEDLYAPSKRGRAYRFSHLRVAQRVLLAAGERIGLLTNGVQLLVLISDPARPDSTITIPLDPGWKRSRDVPDSFRLLIALASPEGVAALPDLVEKARLQQTRVTKELRKQAREAVERFIQEILDHPANREWFQAHVEHHALARTLWREGLITVYRLLFLLKLEASDDLARSFSFASTSLWRNTFSPSMALAGYAHDVLERGLETGSLLESGLRTVFRMFEEGLECTELVVKPLGGALFGANATPTLSRLTWGERAVAWLLDRLLWTPQRRGEDTRQRVHYGPLDVEDLGRVYEALLELEPGISSEPMCRLRRQKLEVVVPLSQGDKYRSVIEPVATETVEEELDESTEQETEDEEQPSRGKKTKVEWIEEIPPDRFYLRVGLGRKASGSYYTPHSFVRFLIQETLGPQVAERSPPGDPQPLKILELKVLDPAMGSGHFLVEACRFLGDKLYEACRLCDDKALASERRAEKANKAEREKALEEATRLRQRVLDIPDPDDELVKYLPSRSPEGEQSGFSQRRAEALCRRLVATHCLYGVDKNPLAVELAKLALWLESHAEGMPLTFLDHRLVVGDSLTGPFWDKLIFRPSNPKEPIENLFNQGLNLKLGQALHEAIRYVRRLEATVGITVAEMHEKEAVKANLDRALLPFQVAAAAWTGGVMLGPERCDDLAYAKLLQTIANTGNLPELIESEALRKMIVRGLGIVDLPPTREEISSALTSGACVPALSYDLTFAEVFYPAGVPHGRKGFHAVLGNPPWDAVRPKAKEFFASFDFAILAAPTKRERTVIEKRLKEDRRIAATYDAYVGDITQQQNIHEVLFSNQVVLVNNEKTGGDPDLAKLFLERCPQLLLRDGLIGIVVPSAFHANEGATGIRRLYLENNSLRYCNSFENRRKLFEIHSSFKFATIVAQAGKPTESFDCAFYLHDDEWLFGERNGREPLRYSLDFVRRTGGVYLSFLELRSAKDLEVAEVCFANGEHFGHVCNRLAIHLGRELHMTDDAWRFSPTIDILHDREDPRDYDVSVRLAEMGYLVLHEGKTFWHYEDHWEERPRYLVPLTNLRDKPGWCRSARYYRLAFRDIASATNERTVVFELLPPSCVVGNTAPTERDISLRSNSAALLLMSLANTFPFDWTIRVKAASHVNLFILGGGVLPKVTETVRRFAAHSALRLTCNHAGYAPLWKEQFGDTWREAGKNPLTWPVLADDERWAVRASIDAVVASAYGLSRDQYAHVLSTFSHASYRRAPELCLARFDELKQIGLEAFTKKHDPYWDIPLNDNLPQPVIDVPIPEADVAQATLGAALFDTGEASRTPRKRKRGQA